MRKWLWIVLVVTLVIFPLFALAQEDEGWYRTIRLQNWVAMGGDEAVMMETLERIQNSDGTRSDDAWADTIVEYGEGHWTYEWNAAAETAMAAAEAAGDSDVAGDYYLAAAAYYTIASYPNFDTPEEAEAYANALDAYTLAGEYFAGDFERVEIPYENTTIPGLLYLPANTEMPYPVVMNSGGIDAFQTEQASFFFDYLEPLGIAMLSFDMVGTGRADYDLVADSSTFHRAVLDYLHNDSRFDPERIAAMSSSMGGHPVTQLAIQEGDRLAAVVSVCGVVESALTQPPEFYEAARGFAPMTIDIFAHRLGAQPGDWEAIAAAAAPLSLASQGLLTGEFVTDVPLLVINTHDDPFASPEDMLLNAQASLQGELIFMGEEGHCPERSERASRIAAWINDVFDRVSQ